MADRSLSAYLIGHLSGLFPFKGMRQDLLINIAPDRGSQPPMRIIIVGRCIPRVPQGLCVGRWAAEGSRRGRRQGGHYSTRGGRLYYLVQEGGGGREELGILPGSAVLPCLDVWMSGGDSRGTPL